MKISLDTDPSNFQRSNGYGNATYEIVRALKEIGHEVNYLDADAPVELHFVQPEYWETLRPNQYHIGYVPWESSVIPWSWKQRIEELDEFWTTSDQCRRWYEGDGIKVDQVFEHGIGDEWKTTRLRDAKYGPIRFLHCLSPDTEILTVDGWRGKNEVKDGDIVATLDTTTNKIVYLPCRDTFSRHFDGQMVGVKNRNHDFLITDEHRIFYRKQGAKNWRWGIASDLVAASEKTAKVYFPSGYSYDGLDSHYVSREWLGLGTPHPRAKPLPEKIYLPDLLSLMGWYISEGSRAKRSGRRSPKYGSTAISISQKKDKSRVEEIMLLIKRLGAEPTYTAGGDIVFANADLYKILGDCGDGFFDKRIPRWVFSLSPNLRKYLLESMIAGDGSGSAESGVYYTSSPGLKDDLQELLAIDGYRTSLYTRPPGRTSNIDGRDIKQYCINFVANSSASAVPMKDVYTEDYSGEVWCTSNDNGTLVTRRNGKVTILGNCGEPAPRKAGQMVLNTFLELFAGRKDVSLTIKAHHTNTTRVYDRMGSILGTPDREKNVTVITDDLSVPEMVSLYRRHDVLVYPSYSEGFGFIPLQGLATGMPTICTAAWAPYAEFLGPLALRSTPGESPWPSMHPGIVEHPDRDHLAELMLKAVNEFEDISNHFYGQAPAVHARYDWKSLTLNAFSHVFEKFEN